MYIARNRPRAEGTRGSVKVKGISSATAPPAAMCMNLRVIYNATASSHFLEVRLYTCRERRWITKRTHINIKLA